MPSVKIFGAGSIGNHLAFACRTRGFEVTICDLDAEALRRTREDIYPERYGKWDDSIRLASNADVVDEAFDAVIVGTPPDTHLAIAREQIKRAAPKVMLVEKPLSTPDLDGLDDLVAASEAAGTFIGVGYNHTLTTNTVKAGDWLAANNIGAIQTLVAMTREYWGGIFKAHPWLSGPSDTYLGFTSRGGGAVGEHSHAINIWQHFARRLGQGRVVEVQAMLDWVTEAGAHYDRLAQLSLRTEGGLTGTVVQDVVTEPAKKWLRVQGASGFLEWEVNSGPGEDALRTWTGEGDIKEDIISKTRPDDFAPEAEHLEALVKGTVTDSPISLTCGLETMLVIAAAILSSQEGRTVRIDYSKGWSPAALQAATRSAG